MKTFRVCCEGLLNFDLFFRSLLYDSQNTSNRFWVPVWVCCVVVWNSGNSEENPENRVGVFCANLVVRGEYGMQFVTTNLSNNAEINRKLFSQTVVRVIQLKSVTPVSTRGKCPSQICPEWDSTASTKTIHRRTISMIFHIFFLLSCFSLFLLFFLPDL